MADGEVTTIVFRSPSRSRRCGVFELHVGGTHEHSGRMVACRDATNGRTAVLHFIRRPHEADELFDVADEQTCLEMFGNAEINRPGASIPSEHGDLPS